MLPVAASGGPNGYLEAMWALCAALRALRSIVDFVKSCTIRSARDRREIPPRRLSP